MSPWYAIPALLGALLIDGTLFGFTALAVGLGTWLAPPAPGERLFYERKVAVHRGSLLAGWHWLGRVRVTDRRVVATLGLYSRVAVLDVAIDRVVEVRKGWYYIYPAVRVRYRDGAAERTLRVVDQRLGRRARDELFEAFRAAGAPVA